MNLTGSVHCQIDQYREVTSTITGHKLRVNTVADKFLVVSGADFRKLPQLTASLIDWLTAGGSVDLGSLAISSRRCAHLRKDWGVGRQSRGNDQTYRWVLERDP